MHATAAVREGLRRTARAPAVLAGTFVLTLLVALPLTIALRAMIAAHLGSSLAGEAMLRGADYGWWQEFVAQATGLGTTFVPSIIGFGAVLQNLSNVADNVPLATTVAGAVAAWLVLWSFLSGGIIDRLARDRATRSAGFFGACGAHFPASIRLGVIALAAYGAIFRWVQPLMRETIYSRFTLNETVERRAFLVRLAVYLAFAIVLVAVNLVFDYARIRIVVEDRRSAIGSVIASLRFIRRNVLAVSGVYVLNTLLFLALIGIYAAVAGGRAPGGAAAWAMLAAGEIYILLRHYLKLTFYASETALFQATLAHAGYTASPPVVWPDSPAAESIVNAVPESRP
jgi:hypothetical protein